MSYVENKQIASLCRRLAGCRLTDNVSVVMVPGDCEPSQAGRNGHYRTRGGSYIRFPSAYSRKGRGDMVYHASTRIVEVGADWLNSAIS